ncbi:hypothetical protein E2C01_014456 [Portunus trituberculatus]|uniref:Uncharacterized protein n=1 Tax=Portunus trituberculatus TaxID=210409 RepID=A0A5B7DJ94_PORTR|nr:hypothetical protein [Portunus trituberculatus]
MVVSFALWQEMHFSVGWGELHTLHLIIQIQKHYKKVRINAEPPVASRPKINRVASERAKTTRGNSVFDSQRREASVVAPWQGHWVVIGDGAGACIVEPLCRCKNLESVAVDQNRTAQGVGSGGPGSDGRRRDVILPHCTTLFAAHHTDMS